MRMKGFVESLLATAETTALMFLTLLGAEVFSAALALSRLPAPLSTWVVSLDLAPVTVLATILVICLVRGCAMESLAMVLLTLPVFVPMMLALDFGLSQAQVLVWFGILVPVAVEVGMISPPFGLNLFVINALSKDVPMTETWRGVLSFRASDVARLVLLVAFPGLSLWLPGLAWGRVTRLIRAHAKA
jgi:TRAP-type C4-dicarboxylate transport system permease large subunit